QPYIYLAFVYRYEGSNREGNGRDPQDHGFHFKTKIVRYTYHFDDKILLDPLVICDSIPGSNDHNGGRLLISSLNGKNYLFYTVGIVDDDAQTRQDIKDKLALSEEVEVLFEVDNGLSFLETLY